MTPEVRLRFGRADSRGGVQDAASRSRGATSSDPWFQRLRSELRAPERDALGAARISEVGLLRQGSGGLPVNLTVVGREAWERGSQSVWPNRPVRPPGANWGLPPMLEEKF